MKKIILLSTLILGMILNVSAQTKKEKITELFVAMKSEKLINSMVESMINMFQQKDNHLGSKQKDSLFIAFVKDEMLTLNKKMYEQDMVTVYDKYFTIAEIQKYIDFYKTPEGKKMLDAMPSIQKDIMANVMNKDMPVLQAKMKKKLEELHNQ